MANYSGDQGPSGATITPSRPVAPKPPPATSTIRAPRRKKTYNSGGGGGGSNNPYRSNSLQRRTYRSSDGGGSGSSSKSIRRATPVEPQKPDVKVIKPVAPPKPVAPSNSNYLRSDSTYQRQLAAYSKALSDYQAEQLGQRSDYDQTYGNTRRDIGLAKTDALNNMENDYAARGLLRSSLYNTDVGKLTQEYQNQYTDLDKQRTAFLNQLAQGLVGFKNEQSVQQQNAMAEALRRKAEKYNL